MGRDPVRPDSCRGSRRPTRWEKEAWVSATMLEGLAARCLTSTAYPPLRLFDPAYVPRSVASDSRSAGRRVLDDGDVIPELAGAGWRHAYQGAVRRDLNSSGVRDHRAFGDLSWTEPAFSSSRPITCSPSASRRWPRNALPRLRLEMKQRSRARRRRADAGMDSGTNARLDVTRGALGPGS